MSQARSVIEQLREILPTHGWTNKQTFNFCRKLQRSGAHLLWIAAQDEHGTGVFGLNGKTVKAHRVVFSAFNPGVDITEKWVTVNCGNSACCLPGHVEIHDRKPFSGTSKAVVGDFTARYLRSLPYRTTNKAEQARNLGVSRDTVCRIMKGETWKHLPPST